MSMYSMLFGKNPMSAILLAILGIDQEDRKWPSGRFRDIHVEKREGDYHILLYTRNGGGNRECSCGGDEKYGYQECNHVVQTEKVQETKYVPKDEADQYPRALNVYMGGDRLVETGNIVDQDYYVCQSPDSAECGCYGCIITYRMHKHPNYISDYDDDFDCTYATIRFSIPDKFKDTISEFYDDTAAEPEKRFHILMEKMASKDQDDPEVKNLMAVGAQILGSIAENTGDTK